MRKKLKNEVVKQKIDILINGDTRQILFFEKQNEEENTRVFMTAWYPANLPEKTVSFYQEVATFECHPFWVSVPETHKYPTFIFCNIFNALKTFESLVKSSGVKNVMFAGTPGKSSMTLNTPNIHNFLKAGKVPFVEPFWVYPNNGTEPFMLQPYRLIIHLPQNLAFEIWHKLDHEIVDVFEEEIPPGHRKFIVMTDKGVYFKNEPLTWLSQGEDDLRDLVPQDLNAFKFRYGTKKTKSA